MEEGKMTYKNAAKDTTVEACLFFYGRGIPVIIDEGRDVTFDLEELKKESL